MARTTLATVAIPTAILAVMALSAMGCGSSGAATAPSPPHWHVAGGFLRDPDGRAVILRGANVAGANKEAPYFGFQELPDFQRMSATWGMNTARFLISWAAIEPSAGQYDDAYLDQVALRVGWAAQANVNVVLDMHQDVYGEGFVLGGGDGAPRWSCDASNYASFKPLGEWYLNSLTTEVTNCYDHFWSSTDLAHDYTEAWRRVAARLASFDNVIGFDVMNEPYWGSAAIEGFEASLLEPLYDQVVPVVRGAAPNLVAFLEPSAARNLGGTTHLTPFSFSDVVYAPHSYDQGAESGAGFDPSHRPALISNLAALAGEAKTLGAALWIGEYGGMASEPGIGDYMTAQYDGTGAVGAGSAYWSYDESDGYGLLNVDGTEKTALLDLIVRPSPDRVAGDPVSFAYDASSSTFTFTYHPDASIHAPTVISVPARNYPNGYVVECGGCTNSQAPGQLTLTHVPPGPTLTVTVHP